MSKIKWGKKTVIITMLFALTVGGAACGKSSTDIIAEQMEAMNANNNSSEESDITKQSYTVLEEMLENPPEQEKKEKKEVSFGKIQNGVYSNAYMGLSCYLNTDWEYYTASELQDMEGVALDALKGSELEKFVEKTEYIMDMKAECVKDMTTVNVVYTKLSKLDQARYAEWSDKEIVEKTLSSVDLVADSYAQAGMKVKSATPKTVYFLGETRTALHMTMEAMGTSYYTLQLYDYHTGEYATSLTLASFGQDKTMELLSLFSKYE